jgi:Putative transposase DNA-binding domain
MNYGSIGAGNQTVATVFMQVSPIQATSQTSLRPEPWTLVRLPQEKALRAGRTVVKVSRWFPSSRLCPACGFNSGSKPLEVRSWTCPQCGAAHDGDVNAARNILVEGRKVAAGLAETRTLVQAAPAAHLSQRLPVKPEPAEAPRERHGRNPGHSRPPGCQTNGYNLARSRKLRNIADNGRAAFVVDDLVSVRPRRVSCLEIRGVAEALSTEGGPLIRLQPKRIISFVIDEPDTEAHSLTTNSRHIG